MSHHFQDADYRRLLASLNSALCSREGVGGDKKSRKRKRSELTAKEKRDVLAKALDHDLSEENCVFVFGYVDFTILVVDVVSRRPLSGESYGVGHIFNDKVDDLKVPKGYQI